MCHLRVIGRGERTDFEVIANNSGGYGTVVKVSHVLQEPVAVKYLVKIQYGDERACLVSPSYGYRHSCILTEISSAG